MKDNSTKGVSRREFLKTAAVASVATATVGIARPGYVAESGPLKIGVIGCGGRGRGAVENALRAGQGKDVKVVAVHDVFKERAESAAKSFSEGRQREAADIKPEMVFSGLDGYKAMMESKDVNYVIIATPPGFRPEHFEAAVNAGKHIFCEKPVATDVFGIRRFMAAAKKSEEQKLHVVTGTQRRHQKEYLDTIKKIKDGAIGDVLALRAYWQGSPVINMREKPAGMPDVEFQIRDWYAFCWLSGDNIVEQHVHNLDVCNWVMGAHPIRAFANGGRSWKPAVPWLGDILDNFSVDYEYPNGVHMLSMCRHYNNPADQNVSEAIVGTKRTSNGTDMAEGGGENPYVQEHMDLMASIRGEGPQLNEAMQVAETTFTAILGRESAYSGLALTWDQLLQSEQRLVPENLTLDMPLPIQPFPTPGAPNWVRQGVSRPERRARG